MSHNYAESFPLQPKVSYDKAAYADNKIGKQNFFQRWFAGIKRTLRAFAIVAVIILIINVSWLFAARSKYGIKDGIGTIREGECNSIKKLNTWLHLLINILSTLLLTGSNAFMAAYCCPSRKEVDKAHARGRFLHVGTISLGNLRGIAIRKSLVVVLLSLSSVPFHLLYNSLIFPSLSSTQYYWTVATEDFLTGAPFNLTHGVGSKSYEGFSIIPPNDRLPHSHYGMSNAEIALVSDAIYQYYNNTQASASTWERLDNKACIKAYADAFVASRRSVLLITSIKSNNNSVIDYGDSTRDASEFTSNWWICSMGGNDGGNKHCNPEADVSPDSWTVYGNPIEYCLSEKIEEKCSLIFSETIMFVVIGVNALKVLLMAWVLFRYDAEGILISVGDAAASFLKNEDQTTGMMCLANKREMRNFWRQRGFARPYHRYRQRWGAAISRKRWLLFFLLMTFCFCLIAFFGLWGFLHAKSKGLSLDLASLWNLGFGKVSQFAIIFTGTMPSKSVVLMAILANSPQIFLALVYLLHMSIMTSMFLAADWANFALIAQTLMVSSPTGSQRGTWLFGAPLGWGLALLSLQTLLDWFVSQSIFVIKLQIYNPDGTPRVWNKDVDEYSDQSQLTNCGYSPIAMIFSTITVGILMLSSIIFCFRRLPAGSPPVVGTCSAAISASCHPVQRYEGMTGAALRWGANGGFADGVGHCSLVSVEAWNMGQAGPPIDGYHYAGLGEK